MLLKTKNIFLLFIFLGLSSIIKAEIEPTEISIDSPYKDNIELNEENSFNKYFVINIKEDILINQKYLIISTDNSIYNKNAFIYTSFTEKNPSADKRDYSSQYLTKNEIIINVSKLKSKSNLYINIHSLLETKIEFQVYLEKNIYLNIGQKRRFKISDVNKILYKSEESIKNKKIMIYSLGENINYFSMKINGNLAQQKFYNGYGTIIDLNKDYSDIYEISLNPNEKYPGIDYNEKEVEIGVEITEQSKNDIIDVNIMDHIYGYLSDKENCYQIKDINTNYEDITILINAYSQSLNFILYNETEYSLDIFDNYYIKLPSKYFENITFCLKKFTRKELDEEQYGEISYDFQIYYDKDLPNIQSFLHPLVNGKIYTYSLKSGEIMIYRHTSFNKYNFLYSASMTALRGKPALYGYSCETYPDCNLDKDKFEQMKKDGKIDIIHKINQYYLNKKLYAIGDKEINGEKMSQAREQYLSVVICESTEDYPNKGECQYTIEINNYNDEIQLLPGLVHSNSILFDKNYYRIKIPDFIDPKSDTTYIKIFFTILSGNANMEIYTDNSYQKKLTKYNYRHVHRKEIFEINEEIISEYYIMITTEDQAFIEIKYETDFHYQGYNKLNPNEINIEFINKEKGFVPYGVINPDYFYPINNTKNNDFYYRINTLDCAMTYKYDFKDEINITTKYHEVKKDEIYFGSSYGFELKLENYFHTVKDDKEDCAMIIYTGEKSKDIPLLIMEDMFHPSDFSDTYYIYPFSINDDFKGILVDIKIDPESLLNLDEIPKISVTFKIGNQNKEYEEYSITKDSSFFISESKIKKYCPDKFYQCSLIIEINKQNSEEKNFYTVLTNVHSSYDSVEYILENKVYNYNLRPKDKKYFYTQINSEEEGEINFMFNQGNGKIYAKLVEKDFIEENPNWNRRIKLPEEDSNDLLYCDVLNNVIKYNSKDKNNCKNGCELYILIESNENTQKKISTLEVSFSINKKIIKDEDKSIENSVVEIPTLDKYIKGVLEKDKYKYYTITIPYDYYQISFNLYSPFGKAYIKLGKGHICKNDSSLWELDPNDDFGRIIITANDSKISKETLKGISFSIGITNKKEILNDYNLLYYLEIQGLYNNPKPYYQLASQRSIICDTGEDLFCNVILYINHKYNDNKNLVYIYPSNGNIKIYAKYYSEINETSYLNSIENLFPNENNYDKSVTDMNYIFLNSEKIINKNNDMYILLTIKSEEKNNKIKLVSNIADTSKTLLLYGTEELIYFVRDIKFHLPYDKDNTNYLMNIRTIKGIQEFAIKDGETIPDLNGNYYIEIPSNPSGKSFDIININQKEKEQGILINYSKIKEDKLFNLEKNVKNEIYLSLSNDKSLPQYTYTKLSSNASLKIEILFHDITVSGRNKTDDTFKISGYIINKETLNKRIYNPDTKIEGELIQGKYLTYEKTGVIEISKDKIKTDDEYYLYIIVEKDDANKNIYTSIKIQYSVNEEENGMIIYQNKFYYSGINNKNKEDYYIINKQSDQDNYIIIDISENIPVLNNFDIKKELYKKDNNKNTNEIFTEDLIQEFDYNGRKRIIANIINHDGIKIHIKKNTEDENYKYYSINYNLVNNLSNFENFTSFNDTLFISTKKDDKKKTNLIFNNILRYRRGFRMKSFAYYIDVFEIKDEIKKESNIYSTYIGNHDEKNIKYSNILNNNINFFQQNMTIEINMEKEELKKCYIRVLADMSNNDGTRQKYIYNMTLIDIDKKDDKDNNDGVNVAIYIFIFIPTVCIIVLVVVLIYVKKKKNSDIKNPDDVESDSLLP